MKKQLVAFLILSALSSAVFLGACDNGGKWDGKTFYHVMNTSAMLAIKRGGSKKSIEKFEGLCDEAETVVRALDSSLSVTVETSSIYKFNAAEAGAEVEIDQAAHDVLIIAKNVYKMTEGYYNPAVYYNVQAFGFDGNKNYPETAQALPKDEEIEKYNSLSAHFGELQLKEEGGKYYAVKPDVTVDINGKTYAMKIDLGGIGKGYAVDKVNALIDKYGFKYGYFNFASSSLAFKTYSDKEEYNLTLTDARAKSGTYAVIPVSFKCVSTSGDYEQYYEIDGTRYCHVFSPVTGKPVQTGIMTATVIGGSAAEDDALTTALMAMGKQKAVQFINEKLSGRQVIMSLEENGGYGFITNIPASGYTVVNKNFTLLNTLENGKIVLGNNNVA